MKVLTEFHLINEILRAFYDFEFSFISTAKNGGQNIVEIVLIINLGFKVLMVNSGTKHAFKYEKRH